ncbi:MAG: DUF6531 domain-containing protein [Pseudomonadota bacterium]
MCSAAAREKDPIAHTSILGNLLKMGGSLIAGALIGAALTSLVAAAAVATVATGGLGFAAVLAIGFAVSAAMEGSGLNGFIDHHINHLVDSFIPPSIEGKINSGSPNVYINSSPAARAARPGELDTIACPGHASGPPAKLAQGSSNVFINGQPVARQGDMTTCGGTIAAGSKNVFIGGGKVTVREIDDERPWWISALGMAIGVALTLCGRGKLSVSSLKAALPCLLLNMGTSIAGTMVGHQIRTTMGHPVNVITGGKILREAPDFTLPGPLPLQWARFYSSHDRREHGLFGPGWSVPYEVALELERDGAGQLLAIHYDDAQGRRISFPAVQSGESHYSSAEGYYLICTELGQYLIESGDGIYRDFGVVQPGHVGRLALQRLEDRNGNWQALAYGVDGKLENLYDGCGRRLDLVYDTLHPARLGEIRLSKGAEDEPLETLVRYRYTTLGELAEVIDRSGCGVGHFAYVRALMTEHSTPGGLRCHYAWEGSGAQARVVRHWTDDGESYAFRYDLAQRRSSVTDQLGRLYQWQWDQHCQPSAYTDPEGHIWRYIWDQNRQLRKMMDPTGATSCWEYDARGRQTLTLNALGQVARTQWHDLLDLPKVESDAAGNRWCYEYDARGNLVLATDPAGNETEQFYDARGLPHTIRDARGGYKHMQWSVRAQLLAYTDCSAKRTVFAYDRRGVLASVTDALGNTTRYVSDALGRVEQVVAPDGSVERLRYDQQGRLTASVDAAGRATEYVRNARGLLTRRVNPMGRAVEFAYDGAHRLERLINENGEAYRFIYDRNDNLIEEIGLDGIVKRITHDARGLATQVTDAVGEYGELTMRIDRDALGRLTAKHARGRSTGFRYDPVGQLLQAEIYSDAGAQRAVYDQLKYSYGSCGEMLTESGHMGTLEHRYDELGNRSATVLPDGRVINRLHYGSGHLHQINLDGETVCDMARDDLHREVMRSQGALSSAYGYDSMGRKTWEQATGDQNPTPVLRKEWDYDLAGELVQKRHSRHGVTQYLYDPLGRIVNTVREARRELFHWDAAANLVDSMGPGGYIRHNRVLVFEDKRFEYDVHGRMETKTIGRHTVLHFRYDGEHRLREVETERDGVRQMVHFTYDALGRRIGKHDAFGVTEFLWDGLRMLQERRGAELVTYMYEPDSHAPLARIDTRLAALDQRQPSANDAFGGPPRIALASNVYYFHNDVSGLPEELTAASGELAWQAEYKTWGNTVSETWAMVGRAEGDQRTRQPLPQNLRFQGQYLDRDTGLHYNTFRFYDPDIGRFISPDPIGLTGQSTGLNRI